MRLDDLLRDEEPEPEAVGVPDPGSVAALEGSKRRGIVSGGIGGPSFWTSSSTGSPLPSTRIRTGDPFGL